VAEAMAQPVPVLHRIVLDGAEPETELGTAAALLAEAAEPPDRAAPAAPPSLLITRLTGKARALGRFQPDPPAGAGTFVRRLTGGVECAYGEGVVSVCVVVPDLMAFAGLPFLDKLINRAVRGTVRGLAVPGLRAAYGGRDFVSAAGRPVGLVGMTSKGGAALFQAVLGLTTPARGDAAWASLLELVPDLTFEALAAALARGHERATSRTVVDHPAPAPVPSAPTGPDPDLVWGPAVDVPIGRLAAGLRLDPAGKVEALGLRGDFMADAGFVPAMGRALAGRVPDRGAVLGAVEEVLEDPARHAVPGVPDPNAIVTAVLAAAGGESMHAVRV
jgi:hypothetical protein